jgi:hypothetical protein
VRASHGASERLSEPVTVVVTEAAAEEPAGEDAAIDGAAWPQVALGLAALAFVLLLALGCASFVGTIRR